MIKKLPLLIFWLLALNFAKAQNLFDKTDHRLHSQWDINDTIADSQGLFKLKSYKPVYFLLANYTNNINTTPTSDNPNNTVTEPLPLQNTELKFQLSLKSKVVRNLFGEKIGGSIWMAYTQTSRWQLYNGDISRPFRETNYEPEIMLIIPTDYTIFGLNGVFSGVGFNHQSNGRANPLSRSWNRVIFQFGWESKHLSIVLKPWFRIQEDSEVDDNPGIENYIGRAELMMAYKKGRHNLSFTGRHSLRTGENNRGGMFVNYSFRAYDNLKLFAQFFHGYGESMIDYNHKQTTIGFGVSLLSWR